MLHYVTIVCLLAAAHAAPSGLGLEGIAVGAVGVGSVSNPAYNFNYAVSDPLTGDNKAQTEYREGGIVKGSYSLAEPDGTIRVVDYKADPITGFNAVVKRIGPASHPAKLAVPVAPVIAAPVVSKVIAPIAPIGPIGTSVVGYGVGGYGVGGYGVGDLGLGYGLKGGLGLGLGGLGLYGDLGLGLGPYGLGTGLLKH